MANKDHAKGNLTGKNRDSRLSVYLSRSSSDTHYERSVFCPGKAKKERLPETHSRDVPPTKSK